MLSKKRVVLFFLLAAFVACQKEVTNNYFTGFIKPNHFPEPTYRFANNNITKEGFELGRKLFYDPILSVNNTVSCGDCHIQSSAFTQHGHNVSHGVFDRLGIRNSPPIMNMAWSKSFMWDGGIGDLDLLPIAPITNPVEMDETMANVLNKLRSSTVYPSLFKKAYGTEEINTSRFLKALSQFMLLCISSNSKYDSVQLGKTSFNMAEQEGYMIFKQKCETCHKEPLFTDGSFKNNGLSISSVNDKGHYDITLNPADKYKFKVPSLRNLIYTAPYMHDGRFRTIDAVLEHYNSGIQQIPNLDLSLQNGIPLSVDEQNKLKAFLNTLNDKHFVTNPLLSQQ